jgi:hypothetical protein
MPFVQTLGCRQAAGAPAAPFPRRLLAGGLTTIKGVLCSIPFGGNEDFKERDRACLVNVARPRHVIREPGGTNETVFDQVVSLVQVQLASVPDMLDQLLHDFHAAPKSSTWSSHASDTSRSKGDRKIEVQSNKWGRRVPGPVRFRR